MRVNGLTEYFYRYTFRHPNGKESVTAGLVYSTKEEACENKPKESFLRLLDDLVKVELVHTTEEIEILEWKSIYSNSSEKTAPPTVIQSIKTTWMKLLGDLRKKFPTGK